LYYRDEGVDYMMRRDDRIFLNIKGDNTYEITDRNGNLLRGSDEEYCIYFKNVNFRSDGAIDGRFLGYTDYRLVDEYCKDVEYSGNGYTIENGNPVRTAKMVLVDNAKRTIIIIQNN
jgi:hypothetical protein